MRRSFIYFLLYLPTFAFFTSATPPPPAWNKVQSKIGLPLNLNELPAEEIPPGSCSSSDEQIASSPAMDNLMHPSRYTPEELAANILVFLGLPGPNPSADVQSASSHGRDHRGYPLGQQSSSCRLSLTSPGKRKTSDSSAVSTSKRYKKGDTSDRHEPEVVINQHFSFKNSVSQVIPTSSKPGYVPPTEKNTTRDVIGKFKEKELAVRTGLSTNKKQRKIFNVYDWNFLREYPESEKANDQQHQYLRYLNKCKGASNLESFFFIPRDQEKVFLRKFVSRKSQFEFNLPPEIQKDFRMGMLFNTILRLSDKKIGLEDYPFFKEQIIGSMRQRLDKNFESTQNPSAKPKIETIMRFVQEVTKVTHFLIVVQLSIFKEHEKELLTVEEVEKHLIFLKELWFEIDEGTPDMQRKHWAMTAHRIFKFQAHKRHLRLWVSKKDKNYHFCWNLVNHWREKTWRSLRGLGVKHMCPKKMQELVNKIIFFSNDQAQSSSSPKKKKKKTKESKKRE